MALGGASTSNAKTSAPLGLRQSSSDVSRPAVTHFNWRNKALAKAYTNQLVTAFEDDPVDAWFSPKATHAYVKHEVKGYLKALPDAQHFVATEDGACIALWQLLPQESPKNEFWAGWQRIFQVPFCLWKATVDMEFMYEERHERLADELQGGHYYLSYIGTLPAHRGKGLASRLMTYMLDKADKEGRYAILEATSEGSRKLYERHGFVVYDTFQIRPSAPRIWFMKRAPAGSASKSSLQLPVEQPAAAVDAVVTVASACNTTELPAVESLPRLASAGIVQAAAELLPAEDGSGLEAASTVEHAGKDQPPRASQAKELAAVADVVVFVVPGAATASAKGQTETAVGVTPLAVAE